ncbi:MAG: CRTAC1 family protein [Phycisphaerales bacterium]|nr:CRTAC1 family protein [Phycisphaerales bacterium]
MTRCRPATSLALGLAGVVVGTGSGCRPSEPDRTAAPIVQTAASTSKPPFVERAQEAGIDFVWRSGHRERFLHPEILGGGVALLDADGDGRLDIYLVQGGSLESSTEHRNALFLNRGGGHFEDVSRGSGADDGGYAMGVTAGDYDNDGDPDLYVTNVGPNVLLRNDGGHFTDVTDTAGVGDPSWSSSAAFVDYDADGDLDLYVCNYLHWSPSSERDCRNAYDSPDYCGPQAYAAPAPDTLYRNDGDGRFTDVTRDLGIDQSLGNGLGVTIGDFTGDGRLDIFVANDATMNLLWVRGADGRFRDEALKRGCATDEAGQVKAGMGIGNADVDGDGDADLLVVNLQSETDSFFRNDDGLFRDETARQSLATVSRRFTRFGTGFVDIDNDGRLDLFAANGRVRRQGESFGDDPYAEPNLLYRGTSSGFMEWLPRGGTRSPLLLTSRGAAFGDLDDDGGIDVVVANRDGPTNLLWNAIEDRGHWIALRVLDEHGRDALGAAVTIRSGERTIHRDVLAAYSYCSSNDPRVHCGLGDATTIEEVLVRWVDGAEDAFGPFDADQVVVIRRPGVGEAPAGP